MRMISNEDITELIALARETRSVEFKASFAWTNKDDLYTKEKVIQTVLGMANTKNGGRIIIGIKEDLNHTPILEGMDLSDLASFENEEVIREQISSYCASPVDLEVVCGQYREKTFVFFEISEFSQYPILCNKNGAYHGSESQRYRILENGSLYTRRMGSKPETVKVGLHEHQEMIELAFKKMSERMANNGYIPSKNSSEIIEGQYIKELSRTETNVTLETAITSKGYYCLDVFPSNEYTNRFASVRDIEKQLDNSIVNMRGLSFPSKSTNRAEFFYTNVGVHGEEISSPGMQIWDITQSGHFVCKLALNEDYYADDITIYASDPRAGISPFTLLDVKRTIYTVTEFFLFISNFYKNLPPNLELTIKLSLQPLRGRMLYLRDERRVPLEGEYISQLSQKLQVENVTVATLADNPLEIANRFVFNIFESFRCDSLNSSRIREFQDQLIRQ